VLTNLLKKRGAFEEVVMLFISHDKDYKKSSAGNSRTEKYEFLINACFNIVEQKHE